MKWSDRNAVTIELALMALCAIALCFLFLVLMASWAFSATCLTIDLEPKDVLYNYDGDTYTLMMGPLGMWHIREEGIDTPERNKKQPGWEAAKDFTWAWLYAGPFQLRTCFTLTLGRIVGSSSRNGITLASELRANGHEKEK